MRSIIIVGFACTFAAAGVGIITAIGLLGDRPETLAAERSPWGKSGVQIIEVKGEPEWEVTAVNSKGKRVATMKIPRNEWDEATIRWQTEDRARVSVGGSIVIADIENETVDWEKADEEP